MRFMHLLANTTGAQVAQNRVRRDVDEAYRVFERPLRGEFAGDGPLHEAADDFASRQLALVGMGVELLDQAGGQPDLHGQFGLNAVHIVTNKLGIGAGSAYARQR